MHEDDEHYYLTGYSVSDDPYVLPNGVLINKLGRKPPGIMIHHADQIAAGTPAKMLLSKLIPYRPKARRR